MKSSKGSKTSHIMQETGNRTLCGAVPTEKWMQGNGSHVCSRCQAMQEAIDAGEPLLDVEPEEITENDIDMIFARTETTSPFVRSSNAAVVTHILASDGVDTLCGLTPTSRWIRGNEAFIEGKVCNECLEAQGDAEFDLREPETEEDEIRVIEGASTLISLPDASAMVEAVIEETLETIGTPESTEIAESLVGEVLPPAVDELQVLSTALDECRATEVQAIVSWEIVSGLAEIREKARAFEILFDRAPEIFIEGSWYSIWSLKTNKFIDHVLDGRISATKINRMYIQTVVNNNDVLVSVDGARYCLFR